MKSTATTPRQRLGSRAQRLDDVLARSGKGVSCARRTRRSGGRPNVGKSSLLNRLAARAGYRHGHSGD